MYPRKWCKPAKLECFEHKINPENSSLNGDLHRQEATDNLTIHNNNQTKITITMVQNR